jgi:hypothetical protein
MTEFARLFSLPRRENTGKNSFGAQNRRNSSQIDPCNQALIGAFPIGLAGTKFSLPGRRQGNGREKFALERESIRSMAKNGLWIIHLRTYLVLFRQSRAGNVAGPPARPAADHTDRPCSPPGGTSPPWRKSYASIWTPRWRRRHRGEGGGASARTQSEDSPTDPVRNVAKILSHRPTGLGRWPARGQAPSGAHAEHGSRPPRLSGNRRVPGSTLCVLRDGRFAASSG